MHRRVVLGQGHGAAALQGGAATSSRSPEIALLCHCARRHPSGPALDACAAIDWVAFTAAADAHSVTELLAPSLRTARPDAPQAVVDRLGTRFVQVAAQQLSHVSQLATILRRFRDHEVRALTFKGSTLASDVYGHLGMRCSSDLDILVTPRAASRVRALMLADGYVLPPRQRHRCGSLLHGLFRAAGRDDTYLPPRPGLAVVDIHVGFAFWMQGVSLDVDRLFDRAVAVEVAGQSLMTPCPDDLLLILAIHGMMHGWSFLRAVSDIDAVVPRVDDWDAVVRRARAARMLRMLLVALLLARDVLGTELPPRVATLAVRDRRTVALADRAAVTLFNRPSGEEWDPRPWQVSFLDGPLDRIRFHARRVIYEWFLKWPWDEWLGRRRGATTPNGA